MGDTQKYLHLSHWRKSINCQLNLAQDQAIIQPPALILKIRQESYFPLIIEDHRYYFTQYVSDEIRKLDMCVEYQGMILPLHYPIRVLLDLFYVDDSKTWSIDIRFKKISDDQPLPTSRIRSFRNYFQAQVKKADEMKFTGKLYRSFSPQDQKDMWIGLILDDFEKLWASCHKLLKCQPGKTFTNIPFCLYKMNEPCIQAGFPVCSKSGETQKLEDLISQFLPEVSINSGLWSISTQGSELSADVSVQELAANFCFLDNFVHICVTYDYEN